MGTGAVEQNAVREAGGLTEPLWNQYVRRTARGDERALAALYDGTRTLVYSLALRIVGAPPDAEEVALDVYTQVWRNAGQFDHTRGNVLAWLMMLTRSRAIDHLRSGASRRQREELWSEAVEPACSHENPEQETALREQQRMVRSALAMLSAEQREAIELAFFSGLSHSELAGRLGQPVGTVKTRIRLGMMKLRKLLCDTTA